MLNSITGRITYKDAEKIFLQTAGVEWEILTSLTTSRELPAEGQPARIFIYLLHREDQMRLYGFAAPGERDLFLDLLKVEGVGPKLALRILSGVEAPVFAAALEAEDAEALANLPGIGRKTAQKIILKLKGRLSISPQPGSPGVEDLVEALSGMGFDRREARTAVAAAVKACKDASLPKEELERELFKRAVSLLSGREPR